MMNATVFGTPIKALCGKVWVPSRDPKKFPVCPECKEIYESLPPATTATALRSSGRTRVSRVRSGTDSFPSSPRLAAGAYAEYFRAKA